MSSGSNPVGKYACIEFGRGKRRPRPELCVGFSWLSQAVCLVQTSEYGGATTDIMESAVSTRSRHARRLFAGIALSYERVATVLSLGQDPRWRHALVAAISAR